MRESSVLSAGFSRDAVMCDLLVRSCVVPQVLLLQTALIRSVCIDAVVPKTV